MKADMEFNMDEVMAMFGQFEAVLPAATQEGFNQAALLTRGGMVKAIQTGPATGKIYERTNPTRTHQASAPGEAPMSDTGDLARHAITDTKIPETVKRVRNAEAAAGFPEGFEYADYLEFGTSRMDGTSRMEARPYAFPEFLKVMPKVAALIRAAAKKRLV